MRLELRTEDGGGHARGGAALAGVLRPRTRSPLSGELGAGKTTLVQGVARGLGVQEHVVSPTFTLVREYHGSLLELVHVDVYRLQHMQDVVDLGLEEIGDGDGVLVVEWGDAVDALLPADRFVMSNSPPWTRPAQSQRRPRPLRVHGAGSGWSSRADALALALVTLGVRGP